MDKKTFFGGLDFDSSDRIIEDNSYRYAFNCHIGTSESENVGTITNVKGNTLISFTLPGGTNRCIGAFDDKKDNTIIYCVFNSSGDHQILRYFPGTNTISSIIKNSLLGFNQFFLITSMAFIDGKLFFWTDDNQEPGFLDFDGLANGNYPTTLTSQHVRAIPYAPHCPPTAAYVNDGNKKINNLKNNLFQFKYQYVYKDNRISAWSPISKLPIPSTENIFSANIPSYVDNRIDIVLNTGDRLVKQIRVSSRFGNLGDFFLIDALDKEELSLSDNATHILQFFNDGLYPFVELKESNKLYDFLPKKAKALCPIDGNRMAYGNGVDGFDSVPINIELTPVVHPLSDITGTGAANIQFAATNVLLTLTDQGGTPSVGTSYKLKFTLQIVAVIPGFPPTPQYTKTLESKNFEYLEVFQSGDTIAIVLGRFKGQMFNDPDMVNCVFTETTDNISVTISNPIYLSIINNNTVLSINSNIVSFLYGSILFAAKQINFISAQFATSTSNALRRSFKSGATHEFGIVYYDSPNRSGTTNISQQSKIYIPFQSERTIKDGWVDMQMKIKHTPPEWATHYQIVYTKNQNITRFITSFDSGSAIGTSKIEIILSRLSTFQTDNPGTILSYDWARGDRIRFIKNTGLGIYLNDYVDLEVSAFDSGTNTITIPYDAGIAASIANGFLYEIYTPQKTITDKFYYEIGECYEIGDSGLATRHHKGNIQNQNLNPLVINIQIDADGSTGYITGIVLPPSYIKVGDTVQLNGTTYNGSYVITNVIIAGNSIIQVEFNTSSVVTEFTTMTIVLPAIILMENQGDVYFRSRNFSGTNIYLEDPNYSDLFVSNFYNIGRPNVFDSGAKEQRRMTTVWYSQPFIPDTNINGFGSFFDTNFEEFNKSYDSIQLMIQQNRDLLLFQELKVGAVPINQRIFSDAQGQQIVSASEFIISKDIRYYQGEYGIGKHPESYAEYGHRKYFIDYQRGAVLRLSMDGITPISEYKAHTYFTQRCKDILNRSTKTNIYGVYDVKYGRYILSLEKKITATIGGLPKTVFERETIAFDEASNRWKMFFPYQPEFMCGSNLDIVSFKDGALWLHDSNDTRGEFYGVKYPMELTFVHNENPANMKVYKAMQTDSNAPFDVEITNQFGQKTSLLTTDFENIENVYWAALWKDENTPVPKPLFEGDDMRCHTAVIKLTNSLTTFVKLFAVGVKTQMSELTNR